DGPAFLRWTGAPGRRSRRAERAADHLDSSGAVSIVAPLCVAFGRVFRPSAQEVLSGGPPDLFAQRAHLHVHRADRGGGAGAACLRWTGVLVPAWVDWALCVAVAPAFLQAELVLDGGEVPLRFRH